MEFFLKKTQTGSFFFLIWGVFYWNGFSLKGNFIYPWAGLHNFCHPTIRNGSTWSKFGARGEDGDVFLFSCSFVDVWIEIYIACLFKVSQEQSFFLQTLLFTEFLVTVVRLLTYPLVSTWSLVSSHWEHIKQKIHPCMEVCNALCRSHYCRPKMIVWSPVLHSSLDDLVNSVG